MPSRQEPVVFRTVDLYQRRLNPCFRLMENVPDVDHVDFLTKHATEKLRDTAEWLLARPETIAKYSNLGTDGSNWEWEQERRELFATLYESLCSILDDPETLRVAKAMLNAQMIAWVIEANSAGFDLQNATVEFPVINGQHEMVMIAS